MFSIGYKVFENNLKFFSGGADKHYITKGGHMERFINLIDMHIGTTEFFFAVLILTAALSSTLFFI
jgi:hypothetical protein